MARPIVGITTYVVAGVVRRLGADSALVPTTTCARSSGRAARPLLVPPSRTAVEETLDALDGLIFSGGSDLDPALYGQEAIPRPTGA